MKAHKAEDEIEDIQDEKAGENTRVLRQIIVNWVNEHIKPADRKTDQHKNGIYCKNVRFQHPVTRKNTLVVQVGDRIVDDAHPVRSIAGATVNAIRSTEINKTDKAVTHEVDSTMSFEYTDSYKLSVGSKLGFGIKAGVPCVDISIEAEVGMTTERVNEGKESQSQTVKAPVLIPANSQLDILRQFKTMDLIESFIVPLTLSGNILVYFNYEAGFDPSKSEFVKTGKKIKLAAIEVPITEIFKDGTLQTELRKEGIHFKEIDPIRREVKLTIGFDHTTHQRHFVVEPIGEAIRLLSEPAKSPKTSPKKPASSSTARMLTDMNEFEMTGAGVIIDGFNSEMLDLARTIASNPPPVAPEVLAAVKEETKEDRAFKLAATEKAHNDGRSVHNKQKVQAAGAIFKASSSPAQEDSNNAGAAPNK